MKEHISLKLLGRQMDKGHHSILDEFLLPIDGPVVAISFKEITKRNKALNSDDLFGFNANVACESKITLIISDFEYFTLAAYSNTDPQISHLKVYNATDFCRICGLKIKRLDCENSNSLVVDSEIKDFYVGTEANFSSQRGKTGRNNEQIALSALPSNHLNTDIRNSCIGNLSLYINQNRINLQKSKIDHCHLKKDISDLKIWEDCYLSKLYLSGKVDTLSINDSIIDVFKGSKELMILKYSCSHSTLLHVYDIFEVNISDSNEGALYLLSESYVTAKHWEKFAEISYQRKKNQTQNTSSKFEKFFLLLLDKSSGFGFKPQKTILFAFCVIFGFGVVYTLLSFFKGFGLQTNNQGITGWEIIPNSFYFSIITFTTTGYGDLTPIDCLTKFLSGIESLLGIFTMAVIIYSLTKRYIDFK